MRENYDIRDKITKDYGSIALKLEKTILSGDTSDDDMSVSVGYTEEELNSVPKEANLGLGCGNPVPAAKLQQGDVVIDLGCGAGLDCFLAGTKIGSRGRAVGVDMTPDMIYEARRTAKEHKMRNVEFRLGEIENIPAADNFFDVCISNCVINLSSDKARVYREILRVLKPGGRISICDIVIVKRLPESIKNDPNMHSC